MPTEKPYELRVRLDRALSSRLEQFALATHRNLTQSVNLLLDGALTVAEASERMDQLFAPVTKEP